MLLRQLRLLRLRLRNLQIYHYDCGCCSHDYYTLYFDDDNYYRYDYNYDYDCRCCCRRCCCYTAAAATATSTTMNITTPLAQPLEPLLLLAPRRPRWYRLSFRHVVQATVAKIPEQWHQPVQHEFRPSFNV